MTTAEPCIAAVLLAAGASMRLGEPKQLLLHKGQTLVERAARALLDAGCRPVRVVVGAHAGAVALAVRGLEVELVHAAQWADGPGASIAAALESAFDRADGVLIALVDQPLIEARHYRGLIDFFALDPTRVVAAAYADTVGAPVVFPAEMTDRLRRLAPERGAASLLREAGARVHAVPMPEAAFDVDNADAVRSLRGPT